MSKETLKIIDQKIIDTLGVQLFKNEKEAIDFGIVNMNWREENILYRKEEMYLHLEKDGIVEINLNCIMIDSGSNDYLFYLT